jgi:hypothetical protein
MHADSDLSSLSVEELISVIKELRQQLDEKNREIERLQQLLATERGSGKEESMGLKTESEPAPGSPEDLLAQLEKMYPEEK